MPTIGHKQVNKEGFQVLKIKEQLRIAAEVAEWLRTILVL